MNSMDGQRINLNRSKSVLIRQLILRYLYRSQQVEVLAEDAHDAQIVQHCLRALENAQSTPAGCPVRLDVEDCGAAYRFFMAVLAVTEGDWLLTGSPRLLQRPIMPLVEALCSVGADIQRVEDGWRVVGKTLHASHLSIDCTQSSQFASALWLISEKIGLCSLEVSPEVPRSAPYIALTRKILRDVLAGVPFSAESDWSSAAFWYAYLALNPRICTLSLANLNLQSLQGDRLVAELFESLGLYSEQVGDDVVVRKDSHPEVASLTLDLADTPDIVPVLATLAVLYPFDLQINGVGNLNLKESRRLDVLASELSAFAPTSIVGEDVLQVMGRQRFVNDSMGRVLSARQDHRMVMAFTLLKLQYDVTIDGVECVRKSYPGFLNYGL